MTAYDEGFEEAAAQAAIEGAIEEADDEGVTDWDDLPEVERNLAQELAVYLEDAPSGACPMFNDIQPPTSVIALAAEAAAKVIMTFERGYRMGN